MLPPDVALTLSPSRVRLLRRTYDGLGGFDENDPLAVARAISFRELPERTSELFDTAAYLATDDAREAILEATRGRKDLAPWLLLTPIDLAIDLARAAAADVGAAKAIHARARIRMGRILYSRVEYEMLMKRAVRPARLESIVECGRLVHRDSFVDGWVVECIDGGLRAVVVYEGLPSAFVTRKPPAAPVAPAASRSVRSGKDEMPPREPSVERRSRRPLGCDTVRWDAERGRLGLGLGRASRLPDWRAQLGSSCMEDPDFLERRPASTLKPVHQHGASWLTKGHLPEEAIQAEVAACEVDDGVRYGARGANALDAIQEAVGVQGYLYRATVRYQSARGHADVTVELPNKLTIPDPRFDRLLRAGLDAAELTSPGKIPDDLTSLAPWDQPEWRWMEVITPPGFVWAVAQKILLASKSNRPAHESFRAHGSLFTSHPVGGEEVVYCCPPDFSEHARDESAAVLKRWKLDPKKLGETLRAKMELAAPARGRFGEAPDGVIALGELATTTKEGTIAFFLVLCAVRAEDAAAFAKRLREACLRAQHPVAIVAAGRTLEGALAVVEVDGAEMIGHGDIARAASLGADAVKLGDAIEPWRWSTAARPCVLVKASRQIYLGRVPLDLTDNQRALLLGLAEDEGEFVAPQVLGRQISANAAHPDQVVRKAMFDLEDRVRASAKDAGVELPEAWVKGLVEEKRGKGYRITLGVVLR